MKGLLSFSTIIYDGYTYRLLDEVPKLLLSPILGKVEMHQVPPMHSYCYRTSFQVKNSCLVMSELTCHLEENDALKLMKEYDQHCLLECRKGFTGLGEDTKIFEYCALTIKDLAEPIPFTGFLRARQIYVDEVEDGAYQTHSTESHFYFENGMLQVDNSEIHQDPTTFISKVTWSDALEETIQNLPHSEPDDPLTPRTMYYVNPTGNVRQNNTVIASVTWYLRSGWIDHKVLDAMLQDSHPVLRTEIKVKSETNTYLGRVCDLVEEAAKGLETNALRKMAPYIEYGKYSDYPQKLLAAVLFKAKNTDASPAVSLLEDLVEALEILLQSGLQDSSGTNVLGCATELNNLISRIEEAPADLQIRAMTALCKMTFDEKVRSDISALF